MSTQQVPIAPSMVPLIQPRPRSGISLLLPFIILVAIIAVMLVVVALVVVMPGNGSPEGIFEAYVDASNDRDIERMFNQTVLSFAPDYEAQLPILEQTVFMFDPETTIISTSVLLKENMNSDQIEYAEEMTFEIQYALGIEVDDYCYIEAKYTIEYRDLAGAEATFDTEILCVLIDGEWYLAIPGYI